MARPFPARLGFKLPLTWREQQLRGVLPTPGRDAYDLLCGAGIGLVEFGVGACTDGAERRLVRREASACRRAGLAVALHPYLSGGANPACFGDGRDALPALRACLAAAREAADLSGRRVVVNLHPAEAQGDAVRDEPTELRARLLERSRAFFQEAARSLEGDRRACVVVEHQVPPAPGERVMRIGDTFAELLEVVRGTDLGLGWDTGHYLLSVERHGQDESPPDEFVRRVAYVHLHDVVGGRDHEPISDASGELREFVGMLEAADFGGWITLEYSLDGIRRGGGIEDVLAASAATLRRWGGV